MKYRIVAVVNAEAKAVQALSALLMEHSEEFSMARVSGGTTTLVRHASTPITGRGSRGGNGARGHNRWPKNLLIRVSQEKAVPADAKGQMWELLEAIKRRWGTKSFKRGETYSYLKSITKNNSGSPVVTKLLDDGYLIPVK